MICALAGILASLPTASILLPDTTTTPCSTSLPDTESNSRAAFSTMGRESDAAAPARLDWARLDWERITAATASTQQPANVRCLMDRIPLSINVLD